jgi:hypothetical protein
MYFLFQVREFLTGFSFSCYDCCSDSSLCWLAMVSFPDPIPNGGLGNGYETEVRGTGLCPALETLALLLGRAGRRLLLLCDLGMGLLAI